jgi:WD40 repeat protein
MTRQFVLECSQRGTSFKPSILLVCANWLVDIQQYSCLAVLKEHKDWVRALCSLPEKRFASGSDDMTVKIWSSGPGVGQQLQLFGR